MARDFIKKRKAAKKVDKEEEKAQIEAADSGVYEKQRGDESRLSKLDFGTGMLYLTKGAIHTREDGKTGIYIYSERSDMKKLAFVPMLKMIPMADILRKQIPDLMKQYDQTDTELKTIEADLEMNDEEWDLTQKQLAKAEIQQLEHKLTVQKTLVAHKKKLLEIEEEKGICIRYSLSDTEGKRLKKMDVYVAKKVEMKNRDLRKEEAEVAQANEEMDGALTHECQRMRILSDKTKTEMSETTDSKKTAKEAEIKDNIRDEFSEITTF